jgi:hypothetical protein
MLGMRKTNDTLEQDIKLLKIDIRDLKAERRKAKAFEDSI